jgi:hypothetical protein
MQNISVVGTDNATTLNEPTGGPLGEQTLKPSSDPSFQFWSLLAAVEDATFFKEEIEYMQWRHTECLGAEDDMSVC